MKIIIYGINYAPEEVGIGKYTTELAEWLSSRGNQIKVITACSYYPNWSVKKNKYFQERINYVDVQRCPLWVPKKPSGVKRLIHLASFVLTSLPILFSLKRYKADLIITIAPALFCAPVSIIFKIINKRTKNWIHIQDFELDAAFELGILKGKYLRKMLLYLEKMILDQFDCISTISNSMYDFAVSKNLNKNKLLLFPNWVDTKFILNQESKIKEYNPYLKELNIKENSIVVMYSGTMGEKQGLDILPQIIKHFESCSNIFWLLAGEGPLKEFLKENLSNCINVKILPLQPKERFNDWINLADIHLLPQRKGADGLVLPSKVLAMLASGKPFISSANKYSDLGKIANIAGKRIEPENANDFILAIEELANDKLLRNKLGEKGRKLAKNFFEKEQVFGQFEKDIFKLIKN